MKGCTPLRQRRKLFLKSQKEQVELIFPQKQIFHFSSQITPHHNQPKSKFRTVEIKSRQGSLKNERYESRSSRRQRNSLIQTRECDKPFKLAELKETTFLSQYNKQYFQLAKTQRLKRKDKNKQQTFSNQQFRLNNYQILFPIGKGGFGKVWKVIDKKSSKPYAMKQMRKTSIIAKKSIFSVMNQRYHLAELRHPFLVNIRQAFQDRQYLYLIIDYCNRGDLRYHLVKRKVFKEQQSRFFLACVVLCLEYMHSKGIIHRDLKPENLVIDQKGYIKVTDLGVSRTASSKGFQDTSGTPGYMAPQVICRCNHSFAADFYSLGVIAYEFMAGYRPYIGINRQQIRHKILAHQVQIDPDCMPGWSAQSINFINRLIQRREEDRLGFNGISQVKHHQFFSKINWKRLQNKKIQSPFIPQTIEQNYSNYKDNISNDTLFRNYDSEQLILRHEDVKNAFQGYDYIKNPAFISKPKIK